MANKLKITQFNTIQKVRKLTIEEIAFFIKAIFISVEIPIKSQSSWGINFFTFY